MKKSPHKVRVRDYYRGKKPGYRQFAYSMQHKLLSIHTLGESSAINYLPIYIYIRAGIYRYIYDTGKKAKGYRKLEPCSYLVTGYLKKTYVS